MSPIRALGGAILIYWLLGCEGGGDKRGTDFIPDVPLECSIGQAPDCGGSSLPVFIGLVRNLAVSCDDYLAAALTSTDRRSRFAASGTAVSARTGIYMTATVTHWVNAAGGTINSLDKGSYTVCGFIDADGNSRVDVNEPVGHGILTVGETGFILTEWAPAPR